MTRLTRTLSHIPGKPPRGLEMWPFGGGKMKGGVKGEARTPALPGADAPIDLEAASLALSPISLRSGEDGGEIDTGDAALRSPAPPYPAEPDGGDHEAAERQQQARPSSGHAVAVPSLPANRPGTSGGSERGGDDRHSRPSSGEPFSVPCPTAAEMPPLCAAFVRACCVLAPIA